MTKISLFPEGYVSKKTGKLSPASNPETVIDFEDYIQRTKDGYWQDYVIPIRAGQMDKLKAPGITASGVFTYRNVKGLVEHSGIIQIDLDAKDNPGILDRKDELAGDPYTYGIHDSISGKGVVLFVKIDSKRHLDAFLGLQKYYRNEYKLEIDEAPKSVASYRFVSYDPDATILKGSKIFKQYLPKPKTKPRKNYVFIEDDMEFIFSQINDRGINLCEDYHDWVSIGMAFANTYGENGRDKFHFISQFSGKYDHGKSDKAYDGFLKRGRNENTIATFFHYCLEAGLKIKTAKTENIERVAKMRRKDSKKNGGLEDPKSGAIKTLELAGIEKEESEAIIDQVMALPEHELEREKTDDLISDLKAFLSGYKLEFNEITRRVEVDGINMDDRIMNTIYIRAKEVVDMKVQKELLTSLIHSEFVVPYHPFHRFFSENRHLKPEGLIGELLDCIKCNAEIDGVQVSNYLDVFMVKWLLSVVASMHGTYSVMVLVLTGNQMEQKTKFFRALLPDDLQKYYAENKLDSNNDSDILMTQKIMIMDDEFGGKSKQEAKKLKEMTSKDMFSIRKPYGHFHEDLKRLAVLCGTSNDEEIINDPTGNRRVIPVNVISIDYEKYDKIDKNALWMELYWMWKEVGEKWMLTKDEIKWLNDATALNEQPSQEFEFIEKYFQVPKSEFETEYWTNTDIVDFIEKHTKIKISPYKLGVNLKKAGFVKLNKRIEGFQTPRRVYPIKLRKHSTEIPDL